MESVRTAQRLGWLILVKYVAPEPVKGCTPHALGSRSFDNEPQLCRPIPGVIGHALNALFLGGYKQVLLDCDSCYIAYMLYSINAT